MTASPGVAGVYRGIVKDARDPSSCGRIRVSIPAVTGTATTDWIWPVINVGYIIKPKAGDQVWILFEAGDEENPVWIGKVAKTPHIADPDHVEQLQGRVTTVEGHVSTLDSQVAALAGSVSGGGGTAPTYATEASVTALAGQVTTLATQVATLMAQMADILAAAETYDA